MSKKKPLPPKKKSKPEARTVTKKSSPAKPSKAGKSAPKAKPAPAKKVASKGKPIKSAKPAAKVKISKGAPQKHPAAKSQKTVSKSPKTKPAPKKAVSAKKPAPAPKTPAKPAKKAAPPPKKPVAVAKPAKPAPKEKPVPSKPEKPGKAAKAASVTPKKAKESVSASKPAKGASGKGIPREDGGNGKRVSRERARPTIYFSLDEIREYLKQRKDAKINVFVPEDGSGKQMTPAARKAAALAEAPKQKARNVGAVSVEDLLGFNPFKKEESKHDEEQIPQKWRKYYKLLVELRDNLQDGLSLHTEDALKKSGKEDSGDLSGYSQHMADAGTDSFDRDFALSLVSSEQEALAEIAEAIERMHTGKYGICEITGKPIPADRLTAVPFTRYSLEGQRELERNRRNRRRGGIVGNPLTELGDGVNFGAAEETEEA